MTDEEIIKELEGAIKFAKSSREQALNKVKEYDQLIAGNTRLIEVLNDKINQKK